MVELRGVGRTYGSDPPVEALRGVDLTIARGDWLAIVGPSGSGKSTLLNILGCLDHPTVGTYLIDGLDVSRLSDAELTAVRARSIGFVFQSFHLLGHRTALENVMLGELYAGSARASAPGGASARWPRSGGWDGGPLRVPAHEAVRGRAAARGHRPGAARLPEPLLCDEPTGNLDSDNTESLLLLFDALARRGLTLVVVTHDEHVAATAGRVVRMVDGRIDEAAA